MDAAIAGGATSLALEAGKSVFQYIIHQFGHVKNIDKNFRKFEDKACDLFNRRDDVKNDISTNAVQKTPTKECEAWLKKVEDVEKQVTILKIRYDKARKCLCGWCPFWSLFKLSKDLEDMANILYDLKIEGILGNGVLTERERRTVEKKHVQSVQDIPSHDGVLQEILKYLRDESIKRIGIWGMPGVGKTTIMKNLNDAGDLNKMFDIVIWVTVSKESGVREFQLQKEVVQRLKLHVEGSIDQVATIISEELQAKKYLLLLDEVTSVVNLHDIGIRKNHSGGKVVLATRNKNVCHKMETDEEIKVQRLSKDDAWKMFREKVGSEIVDHPDMEPLAKLLVKECGGLPQMISVVAVILRKNNNQDLWRHTLRQLQCPSFSKMEHWEEVLKTFKLGYEQLSDDDRRNCLLYEALYPEDHDIDTSYLMECWNNEGFISRAGNLREARENGTAILKDLLDGCLLERSDKVECVKMPMLFRGPALRITSLNREGARLLVKAGIREPPTEEEWKHAKRISLMSTQLCTLPERPDCCMISTLFLRSNSDLNTIPESFFGYMCSLRVLDLSETKIKSLPSSVSSLINLRGLYLYCCRQLVELPIQLIELKSLEVLDIDQTGISDMPIEIGELTGLKCFRASFTSIANHNHTNGNSNRVMIPQNVFSKLSLLEELKINVDPHIVNVVAKEVANLKQLSTLFFSFPRTEGLEIFIQNSTSWENNNFRSFKFHVGPYNDKHDSSTEYPMERRLIFSAGEETPPAVSEVLSQAYAFELVSHKSIHKLSDFGIGRLNRLKMCLIKECNNMESLIGDNAGKDSALPFLEKLYLINLPKLEKIFEGSMQSKTLTRLTTLVLNECPRLKKIFSGNMISKLSELQNLRIENCSVIEEIIVEAENQILESNALLPKLKNLQLFDLPKLTRICQDITLDWPSLERIEIKRCMQLKNLPLSGDNASKLKLIEGSEDWWKTLMWQDDSIKEQLRPFCHFI
ncbi:PREDICTED: probable disease resistance protein At4g27220 [Nelumbo nucifera]|uniref:Disease resistance protein At4g27190-like n=2 Tax=Nelumbo nucifera TaxID=4432 RepID=A0A822XZ52_NELNU|nr:PREDICTED: probable disease resistance protein At4g27220 [Nelumbo nucifera]DAD25312.1 TPA_asm: hypothetical protein HUJ06_026776 [Nelumbo nucifera]